MTEFVDAQEMGKLHPQTFEAPTQEELDSIRVGSSVKVSIGEERFWTEVLKVDGDTITAKVDNDLVRTHIHGLKVNDEITFEKRHAFDVANAMDFIINVLKGVGYEKEEHGYKKQTETHTHWATLFPDDKKVQLYGYLTDDEGLEKVYDTGMLTDPHPMEVGGVADFLTRSHN